MLVGLTWIANRKADIAKFGSAHVWSALEMHRSQVSTEELLSRFVFLFLHAHVLGLAGIPEAASSHAS